MNDSSPSTPEMREAALAYVATDLDLEFPVTDGFNAPPPQLSPLEFVRWCEKIMELTPITRDHPEQSLRQMTGVEFVM